MRVLHIFLGDDAEAARRGAAALCLGQDRGGLCAPLVACPEDSPLAEELAAAGVKVLRLPGGRLRNFLSRRRIIAAHREEPFSIIHTHEDQGARLGAKCREALPSARWLHSWWTPQLPGRPKAFDKFRPAAALTVLNQETAKRLLAQNFPAESLWAVPLGIDPALCPPRLERDEGRIHFTAMGPLLADSGYEWLLEALAVFKTALPETPWEFRLVGEGTLFDSILRRAESLGISEHMAFLGAQRTCDILPQCDILIAPNLDGENGCAAIKEAWATGLPVLCSDLPVHLEMARDRESALIAPRGDIPALSAQLQELAGDQGLRARLVAGGKVAFEAYTLERMLATYALLYAQLAADAAEA